MKRTWSGLEILTLAVCVLATTACQGLGDAPWQQTSTTTEAVAIASDVGSSLGQIEDSSTETSTCVPVIRPQGAWLAADGGRSIPLPNGTSIHLFGDTLLAEDGERPATFVGNTIGVATCDGPDFHMEFAWHDDDGRRRPFFDTGDPDYRMWPADAFYAEGHLYVVLSKVLEIDDGWGFGYGGAELATVENPLDPPADWKVEYQTLTDSQGFLPVMGATVSGAYVYLYSSLLSGSADQTYPTPTGLGRIALADLREPATGLQYLAADQTWKPMSAFAYDDAFVVVRDASTTMYVHWHEGLGKWLTVQADGVFGSPKGVARTADALEGPWSEPEPVFEFPEMLTEGAQDEPVLCYAVAEHPQHRQNEGQTLTITYACNIPGNVIPMDDLDLYLPKTVMVNLEA